MSKFINILEKNGLINEQFDIFVETGLYDGQTILSLHNYGFLKEVKNVYSIEIEEKYINDFLSKNEDLKYINFVLGDSSVEIDSIIKKHINEKFLFWLDGHFSGGQTGISNVAGECPVLFELKQIKNNKLKPTIIIDDISCSSLYGNWPNIQDIVNEVLSINEDYKIKIETPLSHVNDSFNSVKSNNIEVVFNESYNYMLIY